MSETVSGRLNVAGYSIRFDLLVWGGLLTTVALLYGHTLDAPWYLDDFNHIVHSRRVQNLSYWWNHPLHPRSPAYFSFALNYYFHQLSLPGYHLVNIAIHALNAGLVYLLSKRIFPHERRLAVLVALLFAVHPLQVQAVTYVVQRMASLAALFALLSTYCFIRAKVILVEKGRWQHPAHLCFYSGTFLFAGLAVLTKQNTAVIPVLLLLFERYFLPLPKGEKTVSWRRQLIYLSPFLVVPLLLGLRVLTTGSLDQLVLREQWGSGFVTPWTYFATELSVLWHYLRLLIIPYPQMLLYNIPWAEGLIGWKPMISLVAWVGFGWVAWLSRRKQPFLAVGLSWFLLSLAVESSFIPLHPVFEHRLYLPVIGFSIAVVGSLGQSVAPRLASGILIGFCLILSVLTWQRNQLWNDDLAFFQQNAAHTRPSKGLTGILSTRFNQRGRFAESEQQIKGFLKDFPGTYELYPNLALALLAQGKIAEGVKVAEMAISEGQGTPELHLALVQGHRQQGDMDGAAERCGEALTLFPRSLPLLQEMAYLEAALGKLGPAERHYRKIVLRAPELPGAHMNLGLVLARKGKLAEALASFVQATEYAPEDARIWYAVAVTARQLGDGSRYAQARERLRKIDPQAAKSLDDSSRR